MNTLDYEGARRVNGVPAHVYYHAGTYYAAFALGINSFSDLSSYDFSDGDTPDEALERLAYH